MPGSLFSNKQVSRERVLGLTLVDMFIQLVFLLMALLLLYYVEGLDSKKWDQFVSDGTSIFGGRFIDNWEKLPGVAAGFEGKIPPKVPVATAPIASPPAPPVVIKAQAPGIKACIPNVAGRLNSAIFQYADSGIKFLNFTTEFEEYVLASRQDIFVKFQAAKKLSGHIFLPSQLRSQFGWISSPDCQHFYKVDESLLSQWMTNPQAVVFWQQMRKSVNAIK